MSNLRKACRGQAIAYQFAARLQIFVAIASPQAPTFPKSGGRLQPLGEASAWKSIAGIKFGGQMLGPYIPFPKFHESDTHPTSANLCFYVDEKCAAW
jgi:hypothetical protein